MNTTNKTAAPLIRFSGFLGLCAAAGWCSASNRDRVDRPSNSEVLAMESGYADRLDWFGVCCNFLSIRHAALKGADAVYEAQRVNPAVTTHNICNRCRGLGKLKEFYYNEAGVCFSCHGTGVRRPSTSEIRR